MPMAQEGAPALMTNNAMVRIAISTRPLELCRLLAAKVSCFFITFLLCVKRLFADADGAGGSAGADDEQCDGEDRDNQTALGAVQAAGG